MEAEGKTISSPLPLSSVADASVSKIKPDSSSTSLFRSVFPPSSAVTGIDSPRSDIFGSLGTFRELTSPEKRPEETDGCLFGLSVYYGGKDECGIPANVSYDTKYEDSRRREVADSTAAGTGVCGEWWQGSVYY